MSKPYLLSIGIGFPLFGVWMHKYISVKKKRKVKSKSFLGCHIVYTTYRRVDSCSTQNRSF